MVVSLPLVTKQCDLPGTPGLGGSGTAVVLSLWGGSPPHAAHGIPSLPPRAVSPTRMDEEMEIAGEICLSGQSKVVEKGSS